MADNATVNGIPVAGDEIAGVIYQRVKPTVGVDGVAVDVSASNPMPVAEGGTYAYATGVAPATVDVPTLAKLKRVSVLPTGASPATVKIGAGPTITIPADASFDEQIPGDSIGSDVIVGGSVGSYYVSWTV